MAPEQGIVRRRAVAPRSFGARADGARRGALVTAADLPLTLACSDYDRVSPIMTGAVKPQGIEIRGLTIDAPYHFFRMLHHAEFDISEMSLSWYTRTVFHEQRPFQAIPVFPSRVFRHSSIYVNTDSGIMQPSDLCGKKIGCPEYQMTLAVWVKGILQDHYGVPLDAVTYYTGGLEEPGRREVPMTLPPGVEVKPIGDDRTLSEMLATGEIDALYGPEPSTYRSSSKIRRLWEDYKDIEKEYLRTTQIFPIMHTVVIKQSILDEHPWVARSMQIAFEQAKDYAQKGLFEMHALRIMLPWLVDNAREAEQAFGTADWWAYGIEPNRKTLDAFLRYSYEQGLSERRLQVDELFFRSMLSTSRK
jgi:4,5-dihydroxyphthalate decarboxylase